MVTTADCHHFNLYSTNCTPVSLKFLTFCYYPALHKTVLRRIAQVTLIDPIERINGCRGLAWMNHDWMYAQSKPTLWVLALDSLSNGIFTESAETLQSSTGSAPVPTNSLWRKARQRVQGA